LKTHEGCTAGIFGEVDPTHRLNADIVNIDRAARNQSGRVEYHNDFRILKPVDLDRGNRLVAAIGHVVHKAASVAPAGSATG
jgi:hypothetical protein